MDLNFAIFPSAACPSVFAFRLITTLELFEAVRARSVINEKFSLALLADIVSLEKNIYRAVEPVSVRDVQAVNPALVDDLFDGERR